MKRIVHLIAALSVVGAATAASASSIVNTKHDLSSGSTASYRTKAAVGTGQICVFCHTPHNAVQNVPLWNRNNPAGGGFTLYSSVTMKNTPIKQGFTSDSISLFCMSCHDGSALGGAAMVQNQPADGISDVSLNGTAGAGAGTGIANGRITKLGTNLASSHPVNFNVSVSGAGNGLGTVTGNTMKTAAVSNGFPLFKSGRGNTSLECGSCHAVHDNANVPFLRTSNTGSKLCLGCHVK